VPTGRPPGAGILPRLSGRVARAVWAAALLAGTVGVALPWTPLDVPAWVPLAGAVTVTTTYTFGLAVRTGGRPLISGGLALALSAAAVLSESAVLLAGATVATAVVAAVLGVLATKPAARTVLVVREVLVATGLAFVGALAVRAYGAEVSLQRTGYLVLGLALLAALALVYRLGAGLHGLGRRGAVMIVSGVALLTVILAYTEALSRWGSPGMLESLEEAVAVIHDTLGAVPRPIEVLLGVPALAWGVSTRARRRQGWWVCAFGAAGLAAVAVSLLDPDKALLEGVLSVAYSVVLGLLVGYAVIRADLFLTGARGRRARRLEELAAHRPEAGRMQPLL
jgi:hypothetical protein